MGIHTDHRAALFAGQKSGCLLQCDTKTTACTGTPLTQRQICSLWPLPYTAVWCKKSLSHIWNLHNAKKKKKKRGGGKGKKKATTHVNSPFVSQMACKFRLNLFPFNRCVTICLPTRTPSFYTQLHTLSLNKTEPCVYNSPVTRAAALVCRLIVTWWNHVTDVPVQS